MRFLARQRALNMDLLLEKSNLSLGTFAQQRILCCLSFRFLVSDGAGVEDSRSNVEAQAEVEER